MKRLTEYIAEKLKISKASNVYNYHPKTKDELKELVRQLIKERGRDANLNDIDVSEITDMGGVFADLDFVGDISKWDVSNATTMEVMFYDSSFNGDISKWDVSSVENMSAMFMYSKFNNDISKWDVSNVKTMYSMFCESQFSRDISKWDVSNANMSYIFDRCPLQNNPPAWYKKYK